MYLAIFLALLAAMSWGTGAIFVRLGLQHMRSTTGTVVSLVAGLLFFGLIALITHTDEMFHLSAVALAWFALLGIINYPLGRFFNYTGIHLAGVGRATPIMSCAPLVAVALGVFLGGETLTPLITLGTVAIVGGMVLILSERAA